MTKPCAVASISLLSLLATASCTSTSAQPGNGSAAGAAGSATGVGGAAGAGMIGGPSGLPVPPGPGGVPPPTGTPGNLNVLDWAGWKAAVTYTFDDAQPSQIEHYAELQATGVASPSTSPAAAAAAIGGFDSTFAQAVTRRPRDGQPHGPPLPRRSERLLDGRRDQPRRRARRLQQLHRRRTSGRAQVWTAASPFGDTGYDTPDMTRFFLNRGVGSGLVAPVDNTDPFNLPCHAAVDSETVDSFNTAIDGGRTAGRWLIFLVHTIMPTTANWYAPIDVSVVTGSVAHAQIAGRRLDRHRWSTSARTGARRRPSPPRRPHRRRRPDLDLDAARELPARQVPAGHRRRRHALAERHAVPGTATAITRSRSTPGR